MENSAIKIKCPCCGAILAVKVQPGAENKNLTCPVCKESSPFKLYKNISADKQKEITFYPEKEVQSNCNVGQLRVQNFDVSPFSLQMGTNVIGRKASVNSADIQIPVTAGNRMSREHLVIEVKNVQGRGVVHYASLYKERVNETFINGERLLFGDCVVLNNGDVLDLPDASLRFEILDNEVTTL